MEEGENWQAMMASCRKACKILGEEFKEPEYCNWFVGRDYYEKLWALVELKKEKVVY